MKTFSLLRPVLFIAALGLVLAACGGSGGVAATVDGVEITDGDVDELISDDIEMTDDVRAQTLSTLVQWEIVAQAAEADFGIAPTSDEIDAELEALLAEFGATSLDDFLVQQAITEDLLMGYVEQTLIQEAVDVAFAASVEAPTADAIAAERAASPTVWTEVCARHILVETESEALAVIDRLDAGEEFADLAAELSLDAGSGANGGDLGCTAPYQYVDPFANAVMEAPVGELTEPVESEFGFHVIIVDSRSEVPDSDIEAYLTETAIIEATDEWFIEAIDSAEVEVDESYGEWVTDPQPTIVVTTS